jgi:hypothetical protein
VYADVDGGVGVGVGVADVVVGTIMTAVEDGGGGGEDDGCTNVVDVPTAAPRRYEYSL